MAAKSTVVVATTWMAVWSLTACGDGQVASAPTADTAKAAEVGPIDTASSDTAASDSGPADSEQPEVAPADTGFPDTVAAETGPVDSLAPETAAADVAPPDTVQLDAETVATDTAPADTPIADAPMADTGAPDTLTTETSADATAEVALPACTTASDCGLPGPCLLSLCTATGSCATLHKADGSPCSDGNACTTIDGCSAGTCGGSTVLDCNDASPCTSDSCNPIAGCLNLAVTATTACDDGDLCTVGDACANGSCHSGVNTCQCKSNKDCGKFEDGDSCNGTLYCDISAAPFVCKVNPASVVQCPTGANGACQTNKCIAASGECKIVVAPTNTPCSDGNACTDGDSCQLGSCEGGTNTCICKSDADCAKLEDGDKCNGTLFCNKSSAQCSLNKATVVTCQSVDDTACLKNLCNPKEGKCHLTAVNTGKPCDDGNACTPNEACQAGVCGSAANACECQKTADCAVKEDGNLCNGTLFCDAKSNTCVLNPVSVVSCPSVDDTVCQQNVCDTKTGQCKMSSALATGKPCDDGNSCTSGDTCVGGQCSAGTATCQCQTDSECKAKEDGNLCNGTLFCNPKLKLCEINPATVMTCTAAFDETCLTNQCDPLTGTCGMKPDHQGNLCSDGSLCSGGGWCQLGTCVVESAAVCECITDSDCGKLEDGDLCNGTLYCDKSGKKPLCAPKAGSIVVCKTTGDSACLKSQCKSTSGQCQLTVVFGECADGKVCTTQDACQNGACVGLVKVCVDNQVCTTDSCGEPNGCLFAPLPGAITCSDGDACTKSDGCSGGACVGTKIGCDDANVCTADSCSPQSGCVNQNTLAACSDGNLCTPNDACALGLCKAGTATDCSDDDLCTADSCNNVTGKCAHSDVGAKVCGDSNPCTDDSCNTTLGCAHAYNTIKCNDTNPCTSGDACSGGKCAPTGVFLCDDGKVCTTDSCDAKSGCVFSDNSKLCDDGDPCTPGDACKSGLCYGGQAKNCDDSNQCTADACDPKTGICKNTATTDSCSDGNACTNFDQCNVGKCVGKELVCSDGNGCTADSCNVNTGCVFANSTAPCDVGNCTSNDVCANGKCVAGTKSKYFDGPALLITGAGSTTGAWLRLHAMAAVGSGFASVGYRTAGGGSIHVVVDASGKIAYSDVNYSFQIAVANAGGGLVAASGLGGSLWIDKVTVSTSWAIDATKGFTGLAAEQLLDWQGNVTVIGPVVMRLKSDLNPAWSHTVKPAGTMRSGAVSADNSTLLVVGDIAGQKTDTRLLLLSDAGVILNEATVGGSDNDTINKVIPTAGGGFVMAGQTFSKGAGDGWLVRADSNGNVVWQANFGTMAIDGFSSLAVVSDGYLLAGSTAGKGAGGSDNWLVATDRFGNVRWERVWGTTGNEQITNLSIDSTGTIYGIANYSTGSGFFRRDRWGFDSCATAGVCTSLTAKDCDDDNPCTIDTCVPTVGCKSTPMATGSLCSDTLSCSTTGKCAVPQGMVEVPAGKFWMGCAPADVTCGAEEKPQHEVTLGAYAIDKTEVTLDQYVACLAGAGCQVPGGTNSQSGAWNYGAAGRGDHPINGISLAQAKAFCAWKGKRLPTEAEWEKAARGGCELYPNQDCKAASTLWPWGKAALTCVLAQYNNGNSGCGTNLTAPVGSKPGGASPYGLLDMAGNVSEWVADTYSANYYAVSAATDPTGPDSGGQGIKRGGGHSSGSGYVRVSARFGADPAVFYTDQGVRCVVTVN